MKKLSLLAISVMSIFFLSAQTPGTLYHLFGDNGIVLTDYDFNGNNNNLVEASVLQADMKIVLGGATYYYGTSGSVRNIMITRYNSYGSIDLGFADNGIMVLQYGGSDDWLTDIAVQADGKIVAAGYSRNGDKTKMMALRLNTDGSLDNSFNVSGMKLIDFGPDTDAYGMSLGILDDGKIIISGYVTDTLNTYTHVAMCGLTSSGDMDIDFGHLGFKTYDINDHLCYVDEMEIYNDRIILGGTFLNENHDRVAMLSRYYLDGEVDYSFGNAGTTTVQLEGDPLFITRENNGMDVAPDGKILFTFNVYSGWLDRDFALLRLDQDGIIDNTFGTDGIVVHEMENNSYAVDVVTQADGKIIACGTYKSPDPGSYDFLIIRHLEDGSLDSGFGEAGTGIVISNISPETWFADRSASVIFCNMDRLLVSGYADVELNDVDFAMACFNTGLSVGIDDLADPGEKLSIYPNPAQNHINISIPPGEALQEVSIINLAGQTLIHLKEHSTRIEISGLAEGVYILEAQLENTRIQEKFVISR